MKTTTDEERPEAQCEFHQDVTQHLVASDPDNPDAWIRTDTVTEIQP